MRLRAWRRGSKASSTTAISRTATSSGVRALRLLRRRPRSEGTRVTFTAATWPQACTPASVRPAPRTRTGSRSAVAGARWSTSCSVGPPGWTCQSWYAVPSYSTVSRSCTSEVIAHEDLGDLHRVERRALAHGVERDPQHQAGRLGGKIVADAGHVRRIGAGHLGRRGVGVTGLVVQQDARRLSQQGRRLPGRERRLRLEVHAEGGAEEDRHADGGHAHAEPGEVEEPADLLDDQQLVHRRAARLERPHLRHAVEGDPPREGPAQANAAGVQEVDRLLRQSADGAPPGARHPLIRRYHDAPEPCPRRERAQHDAERGGGATRARDDTTLAPFA